MVVQKVINPTKISLKQNNIILAIGDSYNLSANIEPSNATNKTIEWTTNNNNVSVDSTGKITANRAGSIVTIKAKTSNGMTAECSVTVVQKASQVSNRISLVRKANGSYYNINCKGSLDYIDCSNYKDDLYIAVSSIDRELWAGAKLSTSITQGTSGNYVTNEIIASDSNWDSRTYTGYFPLKNSIWYYSGGIRLYVEIKFANNSTYVKQETGTNDGFFIKI